MAKKSRKVKINFSKMLKRMFMFAFKSLPLALSIAGGIFIVFALKEFLYADEFLQVKSIYVHPPMSISLEKRKDLEQKFIGKHILKFDLNKVAQDLLKDPAVKKVSVSRVFPASLSISIEKRESFGVMKMPGANRFAIISEDGTILEYQTAPSTDLVSFEILPLPNKAIPLGGKVETKAFHHLVEFVKRYMDHKIAQQYPVKKIVIDAQSNVSVFFHNSPEVKMGRYPENRIEAIYRIANLFQEKESAKISYIDIQYDNIVVKKKI